MREIFRWILFYLRAKSYDYPGYDERCIQITATDETYTPGRVGTITLQYNGEFMQFRAHCLPRKAHDKYIRLKQQWTLGGLAHKGHFLQNFSQIQSRPQEKYKNHSALVNSRKQCNPVVCKWRSLIAAQFFKKQWRRRLDDMRSFVARDKPTTTFCFGTIGGTVTTLQQNVYTLKIRRRFDRAESCSSTKFKSGKQISHRICGGSRNAFISYFLRRFCDHTSNPCLINTAPDDSAVTGEGVCVLVFPLWGKFVLSLIFVYVFSFNGLVGFVLCTQLQFLLGRFFFVRYNHKKWELK